MTKQIRLTANRVPVSVSVKKVTGRIYSKSVIGSASTRPITSQTPETDINVTLSGFGEEFVPGELFTVADDELSSNEVLSWGVRKGFSESEVVADQVSLRVSTAIEGIAWSMDTFQGVMQYVRRFDEVSDVGDQTRFGISKGLLDTPTLSETVVKGLGKSYSDISDSSDEVRLSPTKIVNDVVGVTDDLLGEANIDDDQYFNMIKGVVDTTPTGDTVSLLFDAKRLITDPATSQELLTLDVGKGLIESLTFGETKSFAIATTFSNEPYFAQVYTQPDYTMPWLTVRDTTSLTVGKSSFDTVSRSDQILLNLNKGVLDISTPHEKVSGFMHSYFTGAYTSVDYVGAAYTLN